LTYPLKSSINFLAFYIRKSSPNETISSHLSTFWQKGKNPGGDDRDKRREAEEIARKVEYMELSLEDDFQKEFIEAIPFPNLKNPLH
jgi:hypothetical protein